MPRPRSNFKGPTYFQMTFRIEKFRGGCNKPPSEYVLQQMVKEDEGLYITLTPYLKNTQGQQRKRKVTNKLTNKDNNNTNSCQHRPCNNK